MNIWIGLWHRVRRHHVQVHYTLDGPHADGWTANRDCLTCNIKRLDKIQFLEDEPPETHAYREDFVFIEDLLTKNVRVKDPYNTKAPPMRIVRVDRDATTGAMLIEVQAQERLAPPPSFYRPTS